MPSREHKMWLELIREQPSLAAMLLDCVRSGLVPGFSRAKLESGDLSDHAPTACHADAVVTLGHQEPALAVIIEVQLRPDGRKHLSWPISLATVRAWLGCPSVLLVVCPDGGVATWARRPIRLGHPDHVLIPLVLEPEVVPLFVDRVPETAPGLIVVSAAMHGAGPDGAKGPRHMLDCLEDIEPEKTKHRVDQVLVLLPEAGRQLLEAMMTTGTREYKSDFARRYYRQGEADGEVNGTRRMLLAVLIARGIELPDRIDTGIDECTDLQQLEAWVRRAATADSIDDLFA